ncbi:unnamed protein product [Paramecium sonneborni]|uniref:Uncharacterized protein n=1 Tax=Paramecium sonneborni TaxID=65129 RepID=A0A8S1R7L8_9CILI|nr:unnamed protein product [Paramecium sonneborni]
MQQQQILPPYTLTLKELLSRPNLVVVSEEGMRFRTEMREDTRSASPIPQKHSHQALKNDKSKDITIKALKIGNQSFYQGRQNETLLNTSQLKTKFQKPYDQKIVQKLTSKILRPETPIQTITNKLQELYNEIDKNDKKIIKFEETIDQTNKEAALAVIESKLAKLHQNYEIQLKKRDWTQKHIKEVLRQQKLYNQRQNELYDSNFERPTNKEIEESYYKDPKYLQRKQIRLRDYQKCKFEKYWKLQPILGKFQT